MGHKKDKAYVTSGFTDSENGNGYVVPGLWRNLIDNQEICTLTSNQSEQPSSLNALDIRNTLKKYFYGEGAVDIQWQITN